MLDSFKAGDTIKCTCTRDLLPGDTMDTVQRLMRFDPDIKRKLAKAQAHRRRTTEIRSRGRRPWAVNQKATKAANPAKGVTWTMRFFPHIAPDFKSVEGIVTVEKA